MKSTPFLFYYPYYEGFTGGPRHVVNLFDHLDEAITPIFVTQRESPLTTAVRERNIETIVLPLPDILDVYKGRTLGYSPINKLKSIKALYNYNRLIQEIGREYRIHGVWARSSRAVLLTGWAARGLGVPLIWDIGAEKESRGFVRMAHWLCLMLAKVVVTEAFCLHDSIFDPLARRLFAGKLMVIHYGISTDRLRNSQREFDQGSDTQNRFRILSVGTITPRKNQLMLLQVVKEVVEKYPLIQVLIVGSVEDATYFEQLTQFIKSESMESHVKFLGWRDDVLELMEQSNLFILASLNEGIPHVIQEAMYAGLPVIATSVGGVPEIIQHGETGFLVSSGDIEGMRHYLELSIVHPDLCYELGMRGRDVVREKFTAKRWGEKYNRLLAIHAQPRRKDTKG